MRRILFCSTLLACMAACPPAVEGTTDDPETSSSGSSSGSSTGEPDSTGTADSTGEAPTTGDGPTTGSTGEASSTGAPAGVCGDGVVDDGEACDDGNDAAEDGCEACQPVAHVDWTVTLTGDTGDNDRALDVAITADGTILVVGYQDGSQGARKPVIVALAPDGEVLWKYVHAMDTDYGAYESIEVAEDGSIYVAGSISSEIDTSISSALHKFSPDHELVWAHKQPGNDGNASARGVALAGDAVYSAGHENGAPARMFVRRHALDSGAIEWEWNGPDPEAAAGARAVAVAGERVIVVGTWGINGENYPLAAALDHQGNKITHVSLSEPGELNDVEAIGEEVVISGWWVPLDHAPLLWRTGLDLGTAWLEAAEHDGELHGVAVDPARGIAVAGLVGIAEYDADLHVGLHDGAGAQLWTSVATGVKPSGYDNAEDVAFGPHSFVAVGGAGGPDGSYDLWIRRVLFG